MVGGDDCAGGIEFLDDLRIPREVVVIHHEVADALLAGDGIGDTLPLEGTVAVVAQVNHLLKDCAGGIVDAPLAEPVLKVVGIACDRSGSKVGAEGVAIGIVLVAVEPVVRGVTQALRGDARDRTGPAEAVAHIVEGVSDGAGLFGATEHFTCQAV